MSRTMSILTAAVMLMLTAPTAARAATIGETYDASLSCGGGNLTMEPDYQVPGGGTISSFSFKTRTESAGDQIDFKVLRATGNVNEYIVVGSSGPQTLLGDGSVQTFPVTPIAVQAGDVLGSYLVTSVDGCGDYTGSSHVSFFQAVPADPAVGSTVTLTSSFPGAQLNESAEFTPTPAVSGAGKTVGTPTNAFTISADPAAGGTVTYTGAARSYTGTVTCTKIVGNAATIVSTEDGGTRLNRTFVQDNGTSGDKLINTMLDTAKASAKTVATFSVCVDPPIAQLEAKASLAGDAIHIAAPPPA